MERFTRVNLQEKARQRAEIEVHTREYLRRGGAIEVLSSGVFSRGACIDDEALSVLAEREDIVAGTALSVAH